MTLRRRLARVMPGADTAAPANDRPGRKGGTIGKMRRAKPPNVIGRGPLLSGTGFDCVIVCIVKDEADYLEEWIGYHAALGVDHFLVYDNGSTDDSAALLEPLQNHGLVTRIDWPLGGGQLAAYNHALRFFGRTTAWLAYYDVDEFLVPLLDDDIPSFLSRFGDAAVVRVPRVEFGFSGHRTPPHGLSIDAYTQVANVLDLDPNLPPRVKSIVQPEAVSAVDIHLAFPADQPAPGAPTDTAEEEVGGVAQLNHYYTRSFEEFEAKRFRGSATGRIARPAVAFDIATLDTDTAATRFSERTQATIERLRQLEPKPYTYGSQLRLEYFPRPDDLGRFAEFALANTAAGLSQPARVAASRLKNRHDGVGLAADLADSGYAPVRGGLSGSVHTEVLVEHMRGRIDSSLASASDQQPMVANGTALAGSDEGATRVDVSAGAAEIVVPIPPSETLRCYSLGFLVGGARPLRMEVSVDGDDGLSSGPVELELPASPCLAGIVEIEPSPRHASSVRLVLRTDANAIDLYDLFVISNG